MVLVTAPKPTGICRTATAPSAPQRATGRMVRRHDTDWVGDDAGTDPSRTSRRSCVP